MTGDAGGGGGGCREVALWLILPGSGLWPSDPSSVGPNCTSSRLSHAVTLSQGGLLSWQFHPLLLQAFAKCLWELLISRTPVILCTALPHWLTGAGTYLPSDSVHTARDTSSVQSVIMECVYVGGVGVGSEG